MTNLEDNCFSNNMQYNTNRLFYGQITLGYWKSVESALL